MQWWIGQVTDPDKGEWGDSYEKKQAEDGEDCYSHRCRVRIVGYHGNDVDLPDKDLPLAHVLLPSNTSTTGGCGKTLQYQHILFDSHTFPFLSSFQYHLSEPFYFVVF